MVDTLAARMRAEYVGDDAIAFEELKPEVRARWARVAAVGRAHAAAPARASVEELGVLAARKNYDWSDDAAVALGEFDKARFERIATAIRDAVLRGMGAAGVDPDEWKTPLELVSMVCGKYRMKIFDYGEGVQFAVWNDEKRCNCTISPADAARAATHLASYAAAHGGPVGLHVPTPTEPNADIVLAGLEERDEPIHAHMLDEYIRGYCEANGTSPSSVSYSRTGFRYALEAMRKMLEPASIASPDVLEQLAEIAERTYEADETNNMREAFCSVVAAILRAAQAYVDVTPEEAFAVWQSGGYEHDRLFRVVDLCGSRIRYRVAPPETPKGLPSLDHLEAIFDNAYGATKSDYKALEAVVAELRPFLHEPTGWELDVTWQEVQAAYYRHQSGSPEGQCWHQVIELLRSRIRPTFECAECAGKQTKIHRLEGWIQTLEGYVDDMRKLANTLPVTSAALEGE